MNQPVYTFAKWQIKDGQLATVLTILAEVAEKSTREKGNLFYTVYQSNADANTLMLYEGYVDALAVEEHRQTVHFQKVVEQIVPLLENREVVLASALDLRSF